MSRYIDGEAALNAIKDYEVDAPEYMEGWACKLVDAVKGDIYGLVKVIPTVDAVPVVHGHWIIKDNPGTGWYRVTCSECGEDVTSIAPVIGFFPNAKVIWDFCPYCGAKMDEVTE